MSVKNILCPSHKEYYLTNICVLQQCTEPLCPECIPKHIKEHAQKGQIPQIENIQNVRQEQKAQVFDIVQKLNEQLFLYNSTDEKIILNNLFSKLDNYKQEIIKELTKKFDEYKNYLQNLFKEIKINTELANKDQIDIAKNQLQKMQILLRKFDGEDYIQAILETLLENIGQQQYQNIENKCQEFQSNFPDIIINNNLISLIIQDVDQGIQILNKKEKKKMISFRDSDIVKQLIGTTTIKPEQQSQNEQSLNKDSRQLLTNQVYTKQYQGSQINQKEQSLSQSFRPQFVNNLSELKQVLQEDNQNQQIKIMNPIQTNLVNINDDILVSCFADQRKIFIYNLPKFLQPLKFANISDTQEINLILDKRIAVNHQCVVYGKDILILGGIERDVDRSQSIQSVYKVNLIQKTLNLYSNMIHRRQGFGICVIDTYIYVCGGSSTDIEDSGINTLERFDGQKWSPLRSCIYSSTGCTLANINNEYLIKLGGIDKDFLNIQAIEIFSIRQNTWFDLQIFDQQGNLWNNIPSYCGLIQINPTELMLFGGQIGDQLQDQTYIISLDITQSNIRSANVRKGYQLPTLGLVDQVRIHENSVYAILTEGQHLIGAKKKVINCNNDKWIYIKNIND